MAKTVIGVFENREQAEKAVNEMRDSGFDTNEISIVAKGGQRGERNGDNGAMGMDTVADGTTTGGVLGGLAGLAVGAGALAIPGLGPIIAAGPIAGLLSGAATGGIAGGLIDWGIPEERGRYYEEEVKRGKILAAVRTHDQKVERAADVMRRNGARDVETH
ncbi:general stress protein [Thermosediminibacter litoriperuensis]|uniref:Heat induced stress protein YflT n=1 Tax=Thermosediminibacter litoriperuensis TaxID=291989 RepID=A0A5S5AR28_9FIRM|nr:general stress protein [Thermosediminibacter litoriperuensis]TYP53265.1 heat induced stress protein YflT [Thermosediminibacter litoriperuensis]